MVLLFYAPGLQGFCLPIDLLDTVSLKALREQDESPPSALKRPLRGEFYVFRRVERSRLESIGGPFMTSSEGKR